MARSIATITQTIINSILANPVLAPIAALVNAPDSDSSKRSHAKLWVKIAAEAQNTEEQMADQFIAQNEQIVREAPAANIAWIQAKMFQFQYDATTPQVLQLDTTKFFYYYPTVDTTKCIITRCNVRRTIYKTVQIKIAKGTTPQKCTTSEVAAAQSFIDLQGNGGANYEVVSLDPDLLFVEADIKYFGQYSSVISANVQAAMTAYLDQQSSQPNFDGVVKISELIGVIKGVSGVSDVILKNVAARPATTTFSNKYYLVNGNTELDSQWETVAGYIVQETTSGSTWNDTLNFIAV